MNEGDNDNKSIDDFEVLNLQATSSSAKTAIATLNKSKNLGINFVEKIQMGTSSVVTLCANRYMNECGCFCSCSCHISSLCSSAHGADGAGAAAEEAFSYSNNKNKNKNHVPVLCAVKSIYPKRCSVPVFHAFYQAKKFHPWAFPDAVRSLLSLPNDGLTRSPSFFDSLNFEKRENDPETAQTKKGEDENRNDDSSGGEKDHLHKNLDTVHPSALKEFFISEYLTFVADDAASEKKEPQREVPWIKMTSSEITSTQANFVYEYLPSTCSKFARMAVTKSASHIEVSLWSTLLSQYITCRFSVEDDIFSYEPFFDLAKKRKLKNDKTWAELNAEKPASIRATEAGKWDLERCETLLGQVFSLQKVVHAWLDSAQMISECIFSCLQTFHEHGITHNDIFLNNVVAEYNADSPFSLKRVKVCDLGAATPRNAACDNPYRQTPSLFYKKDMDIVAGLLSVMNLFKPPKSDNWNAETLLKTREFRALLWDPFVKMYEKRFKAPVHPFIADINEKASRVSMEHISIRPRMARFFDNNTRCKEKNQTKGGGFMYDVRKRTLARHFVDFPFEKVEEKTLDCLDGVFCMMHWILQDIISSPPSFFFGGRAADDYNNKINVYTVYVMVKKIRSLQLDSEMMAMVHPDSLFENSRQIEYLCSGQLAFNNHKNDDKVHRKKLTPLYALQSVFKAGCIWLHDEIMPHPHSKWPDYDWCEHCQCVSSHSPTFSKCLYGIFSLIFRSLAAVSEFLLVYRLPEFEFICDSETRLLALQSLAIKVFEAPSTLEFLRTTNKCDVTVLDNYEDLFLKLSLQKAKLLCPFPKKKDEKRWEWFEEQKEMRKESSIQDFSQKLLDYIKANGPETLKLEPFMPDFDFFTKIITTFSF